MSLHTKKEAVTVKQPVISYLTVTKPKREQVKEMEDLSRVTHNQSKVVTSGRLFSYQELMLKLNATTDQTYRLI